MNWISQQQQDRDHRGLRHVCSACGHEESPKNPLVVTADGWRVHRSHTTDPTDGFYGKTQKGDIR
ncbi:hypothetical protein [Allonocardiopsis opalescens]|uniref:Uncharacterized protein n=1 Tax=Allonocardiopsis opalescens TaxID=1144618 RepID=A0A2T0PSZ4_9ACTN|nr:hypothetical protein [Allonocardiopsis opalescens]PRX92019.1 hypothetical protein CLV72_11292 [Allonocardiopsis opalescens]